MERHRAAGRYYTMDQLAAQARSKALIIHAVRLLRIFSGNFRFRRDHLIAALGRVAVIGLADSSLCEAYGLLGRAPVISPAMLRRLAINNSFALAV